MYSRIAGSACLDSTAASREQCRPARYFPRKAGFSARTRFGFQQREAAAVRVRAGHDLLGDRDLTICPQQCQRSGRAKADTRYLGAEFLPQFTGTQCGRQLVSGSARHPDQAEIADCRAASLRFPFQLDDLVPAADGLESVRGAEDAAPDDRHPHHADTSDSPQRRRDDKVLRCRTTG